MKRRLSCLLGSLIIVVTLLGNPGVRAEVLQQSSPPGPTEFGVHGINHPLLGTLPNTANINSARQAGATWDR